jgi:hypothetical protein
MNIECHFIPHTFHNVSIHFVLNSASLRCPSLRTHFSNLAVRFFNSPLATFSSIAEICFRIAILRTSMVHYPVMYTFALRYPPKEIITSREIRITCRPWKFASHWNDVLRKYFPNDLHRCSRCMGSCTILLEPYGRELSSTTTQFWYEEVP